MNSDVPRQLGSLILNWHSRQSDKAFAKRFPPRLVVDLSASVEDPAARDDLKTEITRRFKDCGYFERIEGRDVWMVTLPELSSGGTKPLPKWKWLPGNPVFWFGAVVLFLLVVFTNQQDRERMNQCFQNEMSLSCFTRTDAGNPPESIPASP